MELFINIWKRWRTRCFWANSNACLSSEMKVNRSHRTNVELHACPQACTHTHTTSCEDGECRGVLEYFHCYTWFPFYSGFLDYICWVDILLGMLATNYTPSRALRHACPPSGQLWSETDACVNKHSEAVLPSLGISGASLTLNPLSLCCRQML